MPKTRLCAWALPCNLTPKGRAANHREPTDSTSSILQARLGTTPLSTSFGHVFRRIFRIEDVMHLGRTDGTADSWRCAALSYKLHFHLLRTEKTNNVTPMLHFKVNTSCKDINHATSCIGKLPRELPRVLLERLRLVDKRNEDHPLAQTHMNQPLKSASCETSKQTYVQPLLQYITEASEAPTFESGKALGHTQFHCADAFI